MNFSIFLFLKLLNKNQTAPHGHLIALGTVCLLTPLVAILYRQGGGGLRGKPGGFLAPSE